VDDARVAERRPDRAIESAALRWFAGIASLIALGGCAGAVNYTDAHAPRYAGGSAGGGAAETLHVVSYNIAFARRVDLAIELLQEEPALRGADLVLLQEMDAPGVRAVAKALRLSYVYYPATRHPQSGRDFGNAVLSRWPIESDAKIVLPHRARIGGTQRIAVAATVRIGERRLRVYSLHLATQVGNGPQARRQQFEAVLADADSFPRALIGGDFNSEESPRIAVERGYDWPTIDAPATTSSWAIDHLVVRGLRAAGEGSVGVIPHGKEASDHRPLWARLVWEER
jgi:endonuclease/exonuclease/phosphatase family metal-dependent hydrolase